MTLLVDPAKQDAGSPSGAEPPDFDVAAVVRRLIAEFHGVRTPGQVQQCVEAAVACFADARIRTFIPVLAERKARDRLRRLDS